MEFSERLDETDLVIFSKSIPGLGWVDEENSVRSERLPILSMLP